MILFKKRITKVQISDHTAPIQWVGLRGMFVVFHDQTHLLFSFDADLEMLSYSVLLPGTKG